MKKREHPRLYVIADIHGRVDLLLRLLKRIGKDALQHASKQNVLITLGDYIDRGPDSKGVIDTLIHHAPRGFRKEHLCGNHEDLLLNFLRKPQTGLCWLINGGWNTLLSYGFSVKELPESIDDLPNTRDLLLKRMPRWHRTFIRSLKLHYHYGDYFFVHAGVRPGIPLSKQRKADLLWIRDEFLNSKKTFGKIVVHGHTIVKAPEIHANRIALDTGAFYTDDLRCLVLSEEEPQFLQIH